MALKLELIIWIKGQGWFFFWGGGKPRSRYFLSLWPSWLKLHHPLSDMCKGCDVHVWIYTVIVNGKMCWLNYQKTYQIHLGWSMNGMCKLIPLDDQMWCKINVSIQKILIANLSHVMSYFQYAWALSFFICNKIPYWMHRSMEFMY